MITNIPEDIVAKFNGAYVWLKCEQFPSIGEPTEPGIYRNPDGGWQCNYANCCAVTIRPKETEPVETHGAICDRWYREGGAFDEAGRPGWLGYPVSPEEVYSGDGDPNDRISHFENGDIIWTAKTGDTRVVRKECVATGNAPSTKMVERLKRLDEKIADLKQLCSECADERVLHDVFKNIVQRRRAFDSKTFFMVTFGTLKAGKSTLVNTFVGKAVSPVGRSKETTLRSSIVMAADADNLEGIYLYSPKGSAGSNDSAAVFEWQAENGKSLMDMLNGLMAKGEFLSDFKEERIPFSEVKLEELLTSQDLPEYPNILPPVIRVDASSANVEVGAANLLKDGVAILDTPGFDGAKANKDEDPFWKSLLKHGDYFLLVQSSMSAFNKGCSELIADLYRETKNAPILLVFNEIASKPWLLPEEEKKKLREDSKTASRDLAEQLRRELGGKLPASVAINAGEASDAIFGPSSEDVMSKGKNEMIEESRIVSLRDRIVQTLREERMAIKERNAQGRMASELESAVEKIDASSNDIRDKESKQAETERKEWDDSESASANLVNAFLPALNDGAGVRIAKRFEKAMEWLMGVGYQKEDFHIDENPYRLRVPEGGGKMVDNHRLLNPDEVCDRQRKVIDGVAERFRDRVKKNFYCGELRIKSEPWANERQSAKEDFDKLRELVRNVDDKRGDEFLEKMFQELDVEGILNIVKTDLQPEPIAPPGKLWQIVNWDFKSVWECDCYNAFTRLDENIKKRWPVEVAKEVAKEFGRAILDRGQHIARELDDQVRRKNAGEKEASESRKRNVGCRLETLSKAKSKLEEMLAIIKEV